MNKGFTLIETIVVISIISLLIGMSIFSLTSFKSNATLGKNVSKIKSLLEEARYESFSGKNDTTYGIKVLSTSTISFVGSSYASNTGSTVYALDGAVIENISLSGSSTEIVFKKNTGGADSAGTFKVRMLSDNSARTIRVTSGGVISDE
jgi:prepilin-type N-terminal cleavage/methylation domain-containing protein